METMEAHKKECFVKLRYCEGILSCEGIGQGSYINRVWSI